MEYRFVRVKNVELNMEYPFMLWCDSITTLTEHEEIYMKNTIETGVKDWFENHKNVHYKSDWASYMDLTMKIKETNFIEASCYCENKVFQGKVKTLLGYGTLLLKENGSYMLPSNYEIIEEVIKDKMVYPQYDKTDIRIVQWNNGQHYYAKIGNMDVVDSEGNQKWNSYKTAERKANEFLKNL